jgi:hypothetical protein
MGPTAVILLVLLASIAISLGLAALIVRRGRTQADRALEPLGPRTRTTAATALGATDEARGALTSTGTLTLTPTEVAFAQWRPRHLLRIARADIERVDTTREHLGKTMRSDVLRLSWREGATEHQVAFFVRDLDAWLADLGGVRAPAPPEPPASSDS